MVALIEGARWTQDAENRVPGWKKGVPWLLGRWQGAPGGRFEGEKQLGLTGPPPAGVNPRVQSQAWD